METLLWVKIWRCLVLYFLAKLMVMFGLCSVMITKWSCFYLDPWFWSGFVRCWHCEIVDVQQENHQLRATPKPKWYSTRPGPKCHGLLFSFSLCSFIYVAREFRGAANPVKGCKNRKQNPYGSSWFFCNKLKKKKKGRPVALGDPETFWMCFIFVIFLSLLISPLSNLKQRLENVKVLWHLLYC